MYNWAVNKTKLNIAITKSKGGDEELIKEIYISMGGLVKLEYLKEIVKPSICETVECIKEIETEQSESIQDEIEPSTEVAEEVKVKKGRKSKENA